MFGAYYDKIQGTKTDEIFWNIWNEKEWEIGKITKIMSRGQHTSHMGYHLFFPYLFVTEDVSIKTVNILFYTWW